MASVIQDGCYKGFDLFRVRIEANGRVWGLIRDYRSTLVWPGCDEDVHCE